MKKKILSLILLGSITWHVYGQVGTTVYGQGANGAGDYNSYFGTSIAVFGGTRSKNTAVGAYSLLNGGYECTAMGMDALKGGHYCTAIGYRALHHNHREYQDLATPQAGFYNTGVGYKCLESNIQGDFNTAVGAEALLSNKANANVALGYYSLRNNDGGEYNSATGASSLYLNVSGYMNTANGYASLFSNTSGYQNNAVGIQSLYANTTGYRNTAMGSYALRSNISGIYNTATGYYAVYSNNTGTYNTGTGHRALFNNTTGSYNTAQGAFALQDSFGGNYNTAVGYNAGPTVDMLSNTTAIGYLANPTASNQVRIGNTSINSIGGYAGWTDLSDGRFKKDVKEDVSGLEFISQLRPVSYTVDHARLNDFLHVRDSSVNEAGVKNIPQRKTGFIAQEVEALIKKTGYVFSGVDAPDNENDPYGIRYSEFVVPLVKAVQELSAEVKEQRQQIQVLLAQLDSKTDRGDAGNTSAALLQNSPNPFDAETIIQMTLPDNVGMASVMIYNLEGKQMKNVQVSDRGDVKVRISASELAAGMYLYSLIADGKVVDTKRMVLTK